MNESAMNNVWKVASRWSETGHLESSILDIFRRHNVVFVGKYQDRFRQIAVGDLIAISDGLKVVAMGLATTLPQPVTEIGIEFSAEDLERFDCDSHVLGCRVSFTDLAEEEQRPYRIGTFHGVNDRAEEFRNIFQEHRRKFDDQRQFEIKARSCTLAFNPESPKDVLWQPGLLFRVPIYQRPYSWKEPEIRRFVGELISSFRGSNGKPKEEPMFIGTMQLTDKRLLDGGDGRHFQEVIDGQQRLSTVILLLKVLQDQLPQDPRWNELNLTGRLETKASSGQQQTYLREALTTDTRNSIEPGQNPYLLVVPLILRMLEDEYGDEGEGTGEEPDAGGPMDVRQFVSYLLGRVYFVVIETRATLSKTLQIFDAINTSGMDLNGGDVFKVRYYEYLQVTKGMEESEFERISDLYRAIDEGNREAGRQVCSIEGILSLEQHLLIARHGLPRTLHGYGASVFIERFFDTVLRVNAWPNFSAQSCRQIDLPLEELARLIGVRFAWDKQIAALGVEARALWEFIEWSRYGRYGYLVLLFRDCFGGDQELTERFIIELSKLFILFSILYWRTVNEVHNFTHELQERILGPGRLDSAEDVITFIHMKTVAQKKDIQTALEGLSIAHNPTAKNLTCRLSALQDEMAAAASTAEEVRALLFDTEIDIEHIQSLNHKDEAERLGIRTLWGDELDRIGNLMVLERSLNRSISNEDYVKVKLPAYRDDSRFKQVHQHAKTHPQWDLDLCKERKATEVARLVTYLCG